VDVVWTTMKHRKHRQCLQRLNVVQKPTGGRNPGPWWKLRRGTERMMSALATASGVVLTTTPAQAGSFALYAAQPVARHSRCGNHRLESRMRDNRTCGCVSSKGWHVQQESNLPG
jgi:hypothetical protein